MKAWLGHAYAMSGNRAEARRLIDELRDSSSRSPIAPFGVATIYAALGEEDQAFAWLEKAYTEHDGDLPSLKVDPWLDPLRSDPRFANLLRRVGLPPD